MEISSLNKNFMATPLLWTQGDTKGRGFLKICQKLSSFAVAIVFSVPLRATYAMFVISGDLTSLPDSIEIMLAGEITYYDTTDDQGFFEFLIEEQGTFHLIINSEGLKPIDSAFVIKSDTSITLNLQPVLYDYFPLSIGNHWTYTHKLREICSGNNVYLDGTEYWEIIDLAEASNDSIIYKCLRNLIGIKIDARGTVTPDTSQVNISDEFIIVEDKNHNILINHPGFTPGILLPRFYTKDYPDEIQHESGSGFVFIYRYQKETGLTFWQQTTGSGHCNTTTTWSLSI